MIRHLLGAFETERIGRCGAGHVQFLDDRLILALPQKLEFYHDVIPSYSHVRLEKTTFVQST